MVRFFIYAKDYSNSTYGVDYYHKNGLRTVNDFKSDVERISIELSASESSKQKATELASPISKQIVYLHWGHECREEKETKIIHDYKNQNSGGHSTSPETIIEWIQENIRDGDEIELLYIITDGFIEDDSLDKCIELNKNMQYKNVVFHAFNEDMQAINLSVAAAFLKCHCKIFCNFKFLDDTDISQEFDYDKIDLDNFITERDNLKSYIKLKYINKFKYDNIALQEISKLKKLRDRLFAELSPKENSEDNLDVRDRNVFLREFLNTNWFKDLSIPEGGTKVMIEKSISTLINYIVSEKKSYSFDALKFETKFTDHVEEEPIVDVNFTAEQKIEFPDIILDDEKGVPVIILTECNLLDQIIFHGNIKSDEVTPASFSKFKSAMECPIFLINNPDISQSIGYFYTFNAYKPLLKNTNKTEPRTRRPFHGGLVLIDTDQFDKYNDYILSATYFDSKKIKYNIGLFYYVLWKNCENKEWMDKKVVEQFKKYVMRRISDTKCKIGLSSLPLDPQIHTSLLTALWYCVELSSCIFKNDPQNFMHERLRMFYGVAHHMIDILKCFNYDLDLESIEKRINIIRHVMILKKIPQYENKVYFLLKNIFKNVNGFLVSEIENPCNLNNMNFLKLNHKNILPDHIIKDKVNLNDYVHIMHYVNDLNSETDETHIKMCEKTFRPYFTVDQNTSFYSELIKITKKVVIENDDDSNKIKITYEPIDSLELNRILSLYNLFIKYVINFEKYPTLAEYLQYISKTKKFHDSLVTIFPLNVYTSIERVYSFYNTVMNNIDIKEFIETSKRNVKRFERIKAENVLKFNNTKEIDDFILKEEQKVNLVKPIR